MIARDHGLKLSKKSIEEFECPQCGHSVHKTKKIWPPISQKSIDKMVRETQLWETFQKEHGNLSDDHLGYWQSWMVWLDKKSKETKKDETKWNKAFEKGRKLKVKGLTTNEKVRPWHNRQVVSCHVLSRYLDDGNSLALPMTMSDEEQCVGSDKRKYWLSLSWRTAGTTKSFSGNMRNRYSLSVKSTDKGQVIEAQFNEDRRDIVALWEEVYPPESIEAESEDPTIAARKASGVKKKKKMPIPDILLKAFLTPLYLFHLAIRCQ